MSQLKCLHTTLCMAEVHKVANVKSNVTSSRIKEGNVPNQRPTKSTKRFHIQVFAKIFTVNAENWVSLRSKMETKECNRLHIYANVHNTQ